MVRFQFPMRILLFRWKIIWKNSFVFWTLYISIFGRNYKQIKSKYERWKWDHWHETTPWHRSTKNLLQNSSQSNWPPLKKSLKPKIPTSQIRPLHPLKNSSSINTLLPRFSEARNPTPLSSRSLSPSFTEDCITQSITWKALQKNTWRRKKSNFQNLKVNFYFISDPKKKFLILDLDETLIHSVFTN